MKKLDEMSSMEAQEHFFDRVANGKPFALVRFGDGELEVLDNRRSKAPHHRCYSFDPKDKSHEANRKKLFESLLFEDEDYYVATLPHCCHRWMYDAYRRHIGSRRFTNACMFIFGNHAAALVNVSVAVKGREVYVVCGEGSRVGDLDFKVRKTFFVKEDAWNYRGKVGEQIVNKAKKVTGAIFLFSAGPYSNLLIKECFSANKENFYVDVGSIFDLIFYNKSTRGYHHPLHEHHHHICPPGPPPVIDIGMPWVQRETILSQVKHHMMEWGSGGATLYFLDNLGDRRLTSIEHDESWFLKIKTHTAEAKNHTYELITGTSHVGVNGSPWEENPTGLQDYITHTPEGEVDTILIDGPARSACLMTAFHKFPKAVVFLANADRDWYDFAVGLYPNKEFIPSTTLLKLWR